MKTHPAAQLGHDIDTHRRWGCVMLCLDRDGVRQLARDSGVESLLRAYGIDPTRAEWRWYDDGSLLTIATRPSGVLS